MSDQMLREPVELTDAELDMVTGGLAVASEGLVNLSLNAENIDVARNALQNASIANGLTIKDIANNLNLSVGAVVQALGGGAAILQRQAQA
jgi:hypothetical protein